MTRIEVTFYGNISEYAGMDHMEMDSAETVEEAIKTIQSVLKEKGGETLLYTIMINGKHYTKAIKENPALADGDTINVIPVTVGG